MKITFYLLIIFSIQLEAQVPGYLGKRLSASATIMAGNPYPYFDHIADKNIAGCDFTKRLYIDYAISVTRSLSFNIDSRNSRILVDLNGSLLPDQHHIASIIKIVNRSFGFGLKKHLKGLIAPHGKYRYLGLNYNITRTEDPDGFYSKHNQIFVPAKASFIDFRWGYGVNRIIGDRVLISYYWETILNRSIIDIASSALGKDVLIDNELILKTHLQRGSLINLGLGIGFLIY